MHHNYRFVIVAVLLTRMANQALRESLPADSGSA